jgi:hypothetical protein
LDITKRYARQTYTAQQLSKLTDAQLIKLIPQEWRDFFPGRAVAQELGWCFYLVDNTAWDMLKSNYRDV